MRPPRLRSRFAFSAAAGLLALSAVGCGGGSNSSSGNASASYLAAVTRAAYTTDQVPGYKFDMTIASKISGKSFTIGGSGSISERGSQGSMSMHVAGKTISEIIDKPYFYVKVPGGDSSASKGKPWVRADISALTEAIGGGESFGGSTTDPTQTLSYLKAVGTVTRVGSEAVRGTPATRYHAVVDLERYGGVVPGVDRAAAKRVAQTFKRISGTSSLPMDVWIDDSSHIARLTFVLSLCSPAGGRLSESMNMELHDYGPQAVVAPPPSSQVTDISDTLKSQVAKGIQQLSCH